MPFHLRRLLSLIAVPVFAAGCAATSGAPPAVPGLTPDARFLIYDVDARRLIDLPRLSASLANADVVFFGEYHDDAVTHRIQLELLRSLGGRRADIALGLEMFERDVQPTLNEYRSGRIGEQEFLERSRPWSNYAQDYRPMVALAIDRGWEVVATNLPQSLASAVARGGLVALDSVAPEERRFAAADMECPTGPYWERFISAMVENADSADHLAGSADDPMLRSMFEAQCARDEAMAESIASASTPGRLVYHLNGAFHTDFRLGIVPRLLRRRPDLDVRVISALPARMLDRPEVEAHLSRADYLIFTPGGAS